MPKKLAEPTIKPKERAFLVGVDLFGKQSIIDSSESLNELAALADTAGLVVAGQVIQKIKKFNPKTIIGSGKIDEIKALVWETNADVIIFDEELSPRHLRELEKMKGLYEYF